MYNHRNPIPDPTPHPYYSPQLHYPPQNPNPGYHLPAPAPAHDPVYPTEPAHLHQYPSYSYGGGGVGCGGYAGFDHHPEFDYQVSHPASSYRYDGTLAQSGIQPLVQATVPASTATKQTMRPRGPQMKYPKKTKIVQSALCELCKIECNTREMLEKHKLGKKHLKNLEKWEAARTVANKKPVIGPPENPTKVSGQKKKAETTEDIETKKRKVLQCGASPSEVRYCSTCNVVCNSESVYKSHLAGSKHAANSPVIAPSQHATNNPVIVAPQNPTKVNGQKKKTETAEDLETKKRKVLSCGASPDDVRTCNICNVVCNSETVYKIHLAGGKHAAMIKKGTEGLPQPENAIMVKKGIEGLPQPENAI